MYAVIAFSGHQWLVQEGQEIIVDALDVADGAVIDIDDVLLIFADDGKPLSIGTPHVAGAGVRAKAVSHQQGDKLHVIKFQSKKRYRRRIGFRAQQTTLLIEKITTSGPTKKS